MTYRGADHPVPKIRGEIALTHAAISLTLIASVVSLVAGAIYKGPFALPANSGPAYITIRTSAADSSLPASWARVTPDYGSVLAKLVSDGSAGLPVGQGGNDMRYRYARWDGDLAEYCYRVASAVGLIAIEIFGYENPSARDYAVNLGLAFQLTNILRDVAEDAARGRLYLPLEDFARFGCTEDDVLAGRCTDAFRRLMAFECARAGEYYGRARFSLAEEDRPSLAAAEAMRLIYEQLLRRVMFRRYDVFGPRVQLTRAEKAAPAIAAWARPHLSFFYRIV
jgi:hypothetical protein